MSFLFVPTYKFERNLKIWNPVIENKQINKNYQKIRRLKRGLFLTTMPMSDKNKNKTNKQTNKQKKKKKKTVVKFGSGGGSGNNMITGINCPASKL